VSAGAFGQEKHACEKCKANLIISFYFDLNTINRKLENTSMYLLYNRTREP
jgi:predicted alpha/beta-fold hydrolase